MNKAVFLDRDGTINVEKQYLYKIEDFELLPGVIEGLKLLQEAGFLLIIITNQSGIARGYYTEEEFKELNDWMLGELLKRGINIAAVYYCPHLPDARINRYRINCECRKPKLGLYQKAIEEFNIDIVHSWSIGDRKRDCSICEHSECHGYLIGTNERSDYLKKARNGEYKNIAYEVDLLSAAKKIVEVEKCIL